MFSIVEEAYLERKEVFETVVPFEAVLMCAVAVALVLRIGHEVRCEDGRF